MPSDVGGGRLRVGTRPTGASEAVARVVDPDPTRRGSQAGGWNYRSPPMRVGPALQRESMAAPAQDVARVLRGVPESGRGGA